MAKVEDYPGFETFGTDIKAAREAKRLYSIASKSLGCALSLEVALAPMPSAISFSLPGRFGILTRWKRAPPGAQRKKDCRLRDSPSVSQLCNSYASVRFFMNNRYPSVSTTPIGSEIHADCTNPATM